MITLPKLVNMANRRGKTVYNVMLRNAGWGIQWYEDERVSPTTNRTLDALDPGDINTLKALSALHAKRLQEGLVVYHYYPTFRKMLDAEAKRLKGEKR